MGQEPMFGASRLQVVFSKLFSARTCARWPLDALTHWLSPRRVLGMGQTQPAARCPFRKAPAYRQPQTCPDILENLQPQVNIALW